MTTGRIRDILSAEYSSRSYVGQNIESGNPECRIRAYSSHGWQGRPSLRSTGETQLIPLLRVEHAEQYRSRVAALVCSGNGYGDGSGSGGSTGEADRIFYYRVQQRGRFDSCRCGALAGSISLVGFGIDSFIEVISGSVLLWRMSVDADIHSRFLAPRRSPITT